MVFVKGMVGTTIQGIQELGLTQDPIGITLDYKHKDIKVDAWGMVPPEIQYMLGECTIDMTLVNWDEAILQECLRQSQAGAPGDGTMPIAGARMGNGVPRFAPGNHFIGLNLSSPIRGLPYRFLTAYMYGPPMYIPIGTEKSVATLRWRAIPYDVSLYNNGLGSTGVVLYDHVLDN